MLPTFKTFNTETADALAKAIGDTIEKMRQLLKLNEVNGVNVLSYSTNTTTNNEWGISDNELLALCSQVAGFALTLCDQEQTHRDALLFYVSRKINGSISYSQHEEVASPFSQELNHVVRNLVIHDRDTKFSFKEFQRVAQHPYCEFTLMFA